MIPGARPSPLRAAWNVRMMALFAIGPVLGVVLAGAIFGMPRTLLLAASAVFALDLALFGVLVRGEWRRLAREP